MIFVIVLECTANYAAFFFCRLMQFLALVCNVLYSVVTLVKSKKKHKKIIMSKLDEKYQKVPITHPENLNKFLKNI